MIYIGMQKHSRYNTPIFFSQNYPKGAETSQVIQPFAAQYTNNKHNHIDSHQCSADKWPLFPSAQSLPVLSVCAAAMPYYSASRHELALRPLHALNKAQYRLTVTASHGQGTLFAKYLKNIRSSKPADFSVMLPAAPQTICEKNAAKGGDLHTSLRPSV